MENMDKILEMSEAEIAAVAKNGKFRSREEIDTVGKLVDIVKDIYCLEDMDSEGYSERDYSGNYPSYGGGSSYARGRRNARRDSMGRYAREGGYYRGGRSYRRDGYSRADGKADYIEHLHDMMEDAPDEKTRASIKRMIDEMEQM